MDPPNPSTMSKELLKYLNILILNLILYEVTGRNDALGSHHYSELVDRKSTFSDMHDARNVIQKY